MTYICCHWHSRKGRKSATNISSLSLCALHPFQKQPLGHAKTTDISEPRYHTNSHLPKPATVTTPVLLLWCDYCPVTYALATSNPGCGLGCVAGCSGETEPSMGAIVRVKSCDQAQQPSAAVSQGNLQTKQSSAPTALLLRVHIRRLGSGIQIHGNSNRKNTLEGRQQQVSSCCPTPISVMEVEGGCAQV